MGVSNNSSGQQHGLHMKQKECQRTSHATVIKSALEGCFPWLSTHQHHGYESNDPTDWQDCQHGDPLAGLGVIDAVLGHMHKHHKDETTAISGFAPISMRKAT